MKRVVVSQTGVGVSPWFVLNPHVTPFNVGVAAVISGTVTYGVEYTYDDPNTVTTPTAFPLSTIPAGTVASKDGQPGITWPVCSVRVNVSAGTGTVTVTFIQAGIKQ